MTVEREAALLALIVERAADLRRAGILVIELGEVKFQLTPFAPSESVGKGDIPVMPPADAFEDPASYPNGRVAGYGRPRDDD